MISLLYATASFAINMPRKMRAAVVDAAGSPIVVRNDVSVPTIENLKSGQVLVRVRACGCCHTDLHACRADWPVKPSFPLIPGHEGIGIVVAKSAFDDENDDESNVQIGDIVGLPWLQHTCGKCEFCRAGKENLCRASATMGYGVSGAYAEYAVGFASHVVKIPPALGMEEAAPILCAGVTTYSALKALNLNPNDFVGVIGAAGGLGSLGVQYASALGFRTVALVRGASKQRLVQSEYAPFLAIDMSVSGFEETLMKQVGGGLHGILCTAPSTSAIEAGISLLRPGGKMVVVGVPPGKISVSVPDIVFNEKQIMGSLVGPNSNIQRYRLLVYELTRPTPFPFLLLDNHVGGHEKGPARGSGYCCREACCASHRDTTTGRGETMPPRLLLLHVLNPFHSSWCTHTHRRRRRSHKWNEVR